MTKHPILQKSTLSTPIGDMIAIADNDGLYMLQFANDNKIESDIKRLDATIQNSNNAIINSIQKELALYFSGTLKTFETPLHITGTDFQKKAWQALLAIPYGETRSYLEQAKLAGKEKAYRAIANANNKNRFAIIVPCHRVINHNGNLGGYATGLTRKKKLLSLEQGSLIF